MQHGVVGMYITLKATHPVALGGSKCRQTIGPGTELHIAWTFSRWRKKKPVEEMKAAASVVQEKLGLCDV